ncbi:MAG: bifunctional folylpolyglutamate synthase/dihydrofolate synthase [Lentisphaeria bacterium]|nr:bifunctional folylpolyglutamate synthase/dihydrofolate synthase [Lentisphaeria bacterium]
MENCCTYLNSLELNGIKPGLAVTEELYRRSGELGRNLKFIHIAGTNGKGSTGAMIQKSLRQVGFNVGFYTSPHLMNFRERIRINGRAISENDLELEYRYLRKFADSMRQDGISVTYFEFTTILAINYFARMQVDFVVLETGMGGRFDSTNIFDSILSIITNISPDHQRFLGETLAEIAFEKAGIIKSGHPCFAGIMAEEPLQVIRKQAAEKNAELFECESIDDLPFLYRDGKQFFEVNGHKIELNLIGAMQRKNARLAVNVLEYLSQKYQFDLDRALTGLSTVEWQGRCQKLADNLIIDGGHNIDGIRSLIECLLEAYPDYKYNFIFGSFKDKDSMECLELLSQVANRFYFKKIAYEYRDSYDYCELSEFLMKKSDKVFEKLENWSTVQKLLDANAAHKAKEIFVICGSLYLVGEYFTYINYDLEQI